MADVLTETKHAPRSYNGLRMTAEEFFALGETDERYELIDGVVVMSPSATPLHQFIAARICNQIENHLILHAVGSVYWDTDVQFGRNHDGRDVVYRPEMVFYRKGRFEGIPRKLVGPPDLALEVLSPESHHRDLQTKRADFEYFGVGEYWVADPEDMTLLCLRLKEGRYVKLPLIADRLASEVVDGFSLDWAAVRRAVAG